MAAISTLAIVFYVSVAIAVGISVYLGHKANFGRKEWSVYGAGLVLAAVAGLLGQQGILGVPVETSMGYLSSLITWPGAPQIGGIVPVGIPGPTWFAIGFLLLARKRWGGDVGRYFEIAAIGLIIQAAMYVVHLSWHFQQTGGPETLPVWGLSQPFWFVFFHGGAALSFGLIAYAFYGYWKSVQ